MADFLTEYITSLTPSIVVVGRVSLCLILWCIFKNRETINDFFNSLYNKTKQKEELLQTIKNNQDTIKHIIENRQHDREQSLEIQKELKDAQKELAESISVISKKLDDMQKSTDERFEASEDKNNKRIRAELKDKIGQSYRYYHSKGKINDMELEALEGLIEEYETAGGENSFVHTVVQKEMYTWEKVIRE